nr:hypothetical protein [Tanacetum cinerariifolium]
MREILGSSLAVGVFLQEGKEWGLSPKGKVRVLHTAQLDVTGRRSGSGVKEKKDGAGDDSMDNCGMKSVPVTPNATSSVDDMGSMHVNKSGDHVSPLISFANLVKGNSSRKALNFRPLFTPAGNGVNVYVSKESVSVVNERLNKTLCTFSFWANEWLIFGSKDGMEAMLENGPCSMMFDYCVYTEYGLSAIATKLGTSLMLDSYTAAMCTDSWERASYARAMVELRAVVELTDTIVVALPKFSSDWFY